MPIKVTLNTSLHTIKDTVKQCFYIIIYTPNRYIYIILDRFYIIDCIITFNLHSFCRIFNYIKPKINI